MKKLLCLLVLTASCFGTTSVIGHISTLGTGSVTSGALVRFYLRGCGRNQPRITGTGAIAPQVSNGNFYFDIAADGSGNVSGTLYSTRDAAGTGNGEIECGGSLTAVWYGMVVINSGVAGPEVPITAKSGATIDISNVTPNSTQPVVTAPTGDNTYARLDGGNMPFTGNAAFGSGSFSLFEPSVGPLKVKYQVNQAYTDRQFPLHVQMQDGTAPASLPADDGTAAAVFHAMRGSDGAKPTMAANPLVQCSTFTAGSCIGMELDVNVGTDSDGTTAGQGDGLSIASGWSHKPFRALVIGATLAANNWWHYGIDLHHFSDYGIKIGDAQAGGTGIGLMLAGNANMQFSQVMNGKDSNFVKIIPTTDNDLPVWFVSNAADNAPRAEIYKAGFQGDYFRSSTTSPADAGQVRLASADSISWRNNANSGNVSIGHDTSDNITVPALKASGAVEADGGLKAGASGSTISDTRNLVQGVYQTSGTANLATHMVYGSVQLSSGTPSTGTVTLAGAAVFTSSATYRCTLTNETTQANPVKITYTDGSHFTATGPNTVTDFVSFICVGN